MKRLCKDILRSIGNGFRISFSIFILEWEVRVIFRLLVVFGIWFGRLSVLLIICLLLDID